MPFDTGSLPISSTISACTPLADASTLLLSISTSFEEPSLRENAQIKFAQSSTHLLAGQAITNNEPKRSMATQSIYGPIVRTDQSCCSQTYSPSRKYLVSFFQSSNKDQSKAAAKSDQWIRISSQNIHEATSIATTTIELDHDPFAFAPSWSPNEDYFLYIAEMADSTGDHKDPMNVFHSDTGSSGEQNMDPIVGRHFYRPDFGEQFSGRGYPRLFMVDVSKGLVVDITPPDVLGHVLEAIWVAHRGKLLVLANLLVPAPILLGLSYCNNRESVLLLLDPISTTEGKNDLQTTHQNGGRHRTITAKITHCPSGVLAKNAEKQTNFSALIAGENEGFFLLRAKFIDAHYSAAVLVSGRLDTADASLNIALTPCGDGISNTDFDLQMLFHAKPLFNYTLHGTIFLNCRLAFQIATIVIDVRRRKAFRMMPNMDNPLCSFKVLDAISLGDAQSTIVGVGQCSSLDMPPRMVIFEMSNGQERPVHFYSPFTGDTTIEDAPLHPSQCILKPTSYDPLERRRCRRFDLTREFQMAFPDYGTAPIVLDVLLVDRCASSGTCSSGDSDVDMDSAKNMPLIVVAHGGPHSSCVNQWNRLHDYLLSEGYGLLFVNYTGSSAYDMESLSFLVGRIGEIDVQQVKFAAEWARDKFSIDPKQLFYLGGSHSGYIGAWLAAGCTARFRLNELAVSGEIQGAAENQCPFAALVLINPVTDITLMLCTSDIPDWAINETGLSFAGEFSKLTTAKHSEELWIRSPIRVASMIHKPMLLLMGMEDRRVPPLGGIRFSQSITNPQPKVVCFPNEGHMLEGTRTQQVMAHTITRFLRNLNS